MRYIEPHGHRVSRTTDDYLDKVTASSVPPSKALLGSLCPR